MCFLIIFLLLMSTCCLSGIYNLRINCFLFLANSKNDNTHCVKSYNISRISFLVPIKYRACYAFYPIIRIMFFLVIFTIFQSLQCFFPKLIGYTMDINTHFAGYLLKLELYVTLFGKIPIYISIILNSNYIGEKLIGAIVK